MCIRDSQYIESVRDGKNSIDFQIITELGVLVGKREADFAYVISQDKGYAASIDALRVRLSLIHIFPAVVRLSARSWRLEFPSHSAILH